MRTQHWSLQAAQRFSLLAVVGAAALVFAGCDSGNGPTVKTDYDKSANFAQYHTFAFQKGRIVTRLGTTDPNNTLVADRIQAAVVDQFQQKGLSETTQNPDLVATYVAGAKTKQEIENLGPQPYYSSYFGGPFGFERGGYYGAGYNQFYTNTYTEGTLILDLMDTHTKKLVWRAYVTGPVDKPDQKAINGAVAAALKQFPPMSKGQ